MKQQAVEISTDSNADSTIKKYREIKRQNPQNHYWSTWVHVQFCIVDQTRTRRHASWTKMKCWSGPSINSRRRRRWYRGWIIRKFWTHNTISLSAVNHYLASPGTDRDRHQQLGFLTENAESLGEIWIDRFCCDGRWLGSSDGQPVWKLKLSLTYLSTWNTIQIYHRGLKMI